MRNEFDSWFIEDRIYWYKNKLRSLMAIIEGKNTLSMSDLELARAEMKELKERFKSDKKIGGASRRFGAMSEKEQQYYMAVMGAATHISVKWNSHPVRSNWFSEIDACMIDFDFYYPSI